MNDSIFLLLFLLCLEHLVKCDINVSDQRFRELPPIFRIDDESSCRENGKSFCTLSLVIQPPNGTATNLYWKLIEDTVAHPKFYNHNELFHAVCLDDFCPASTDTNAANLDITERLSECYRLKYEKLGLKFLVLNLNCSNPEKNSLGLFDFIVPFVVIAYFVIIIYASYRDYCNNFKSEKVKAPESNGRKTSVVEVFSVISNWKKLCSFDDRPEFQKLKFVQGIRFYNMLLVLFFHTQCSYLNAYIENTEYFELLYRSPIKSSFNTLSVFLVQTFFLISAFLLSYQVCQSMEKYRGSKLKYTFYTFLNRYLRLLPPLFTILMILTSKQVIRLYDGPLRNFYSRKEVLRCRQNWWANFLFINNHYNESQMCYLISWYLAADTQLYLVSLLILLVIWKYPQRRKLILGMAIFVGVLIPIIMSYIYEVDIIYRFTPENSKIDNYRAFKFSIIYFSTYTNMASYMVGLALGCFYYTTEKSKNYKRILQFRWTGLFFFLPTIAVTVASYSHSRFASIILSGIIKPCFALGIGAGILALTHRNIGIVKWCCELKPVLFLSNFTYSTYIVQAGIVFFRTATVSKLLYVSDSAIILSFLQDAVYSIFCGFLMHILVEMPALQLQKKYIPQIKQLATDNPKKLK
ncbi:O-acyltransferase like protein-like [Euwallacea fornicatus]|uniref:O-acyltransferase like protein-like n=1 Tax=Euwallacea fornicatus TaxID=995702 RepID=UPI0033904CFA